MATVSLSAQRPWRKRYLGFWAWCWLAGAARTAAGRLAKWLSGGVKAAQRPGVTQNSEEFLINNLILISSIASCLMAAVNN
jgi:hypothetical protein